MKFSWVTLSLLAASCASGGGAMAMSHYDEVMIGSSAEQVEALVGKPNTVRKQPGGVVEYEYVERIKIGGRDAEERHYFILIKDGHVVSKRVKQSSPLPYGFDSYERNYRDRINGTDSTHKPHDSE